jgi:peptidoglycan/LPS O-acetylase OafA/YrhL
VPQVATVPRALAQASAGVPMPVGEIRALTSLRGIAAMIVVLQHFSATAEQHSAGRIPSLVPHGYMAVDLFFVLSGFIMAYTYLADFQARGVRAFPDFLLKRVARIVPLNTAAVLFVLLAGVVSNAVLSRNIIHQSTTPFVDGLCNLFMLQGIGIGTNLNAPSWSISTEFTAYLAFPALLAIIFTRRRWILTLAAGASVVSLVVIAITHTRLGLNTESIEGGVVRCFAEFTLGLATYRAVSMARIRGWLATDGIATAAVGCSVILLLLRLDLFIAGIAPVLVATLACNRGRVARVFSARVPYFLGVISFSIYLLHSPLRPICLEILRVAHPEPLAAPLAMAAALFGSLLVLPFAWLGFILIERPGRQLIRQFISFVARRPRGAWRTGSVA